MSWLRLRLCKIGSDPILYFPFPFLGCFQFGRFSSLLRISLSHFCHLPRRGFAPLGSFLLNSAPAGPKEDERDSAEPSQRCVGLSVSRARELELGALLPLSLSWLSFFHVGSIPGRCSPFSAARSVLFIYCIPSLTVVLP